MATPNLGTEECLALLRDASLRPESIAEEMECAGCVRPKAAQVQAARDAVSKLKTEAVAQPAGFSGPEAAALARVEALSGQAPISCMGPPRHAENHPGGQPA